MQLSEDLVANEVVTISARMSEATFAQEQIGAFAQEQPDVARFLTLVVGRKLGAEEAMRTVFHATVIAACFARAGAAPALTTFAALDAVGDDPCAALRVEQPSLADYLAANVEAEEGRTPLCRVALCWSRAAVAGGS